MEMLGQPHDELWEEDYVPLDPRSTIYGQSKWPDWWANQKAIKNAP